MLAEASITLAEENTMDARKLYNLDAASPAELQRLAELAIGRLLALGSRPSEPGDLDEYEECRRIILAAGAALL